MGIVLAMGVTPQENDQHLVQPTTEQLLKNIPVADSASLVADAGYISGENIAYLETVVKIDAFIAMRAGEENKPEFHCNKFQYDES